MLLPLPLLQLAWCSKGPLRATEAKWAALSVRGQEILAAVEFIVVGRSDTFSPDSLQSTVEGAVRGLCHRIHCVVHPPLPHSSTDVRKALQSGAMPEQMLPPGVVAYIRQHGLYGFTAAAL